ncbi:MAG TPA: hypothetical protein VFI42_01645, partial [Thermomicrobiaceae bacterium]|nr:hypothetical protein [Thermomicrobiaceae bacterium]
MLVLGLAGLLGWLSLPLGRPLPLVLLAIGLIAFLVVLFLLYGYYSIRYELSARALDIRWA